jgi:hypothetical protein
MAKRQLFVVTSIISQRVGSALFGLLDMTTGCQTTLCMSSIFNRIFGDSGLVHKLTVNEFDRMEMIDTPVTQELEPALALAGLIIEIVLTMICLASISYAVIAKSYTVNVYPLLILVGLFCVNSMSVAYYGMFFHGAGPVTNGMWKFLLVPAFIVYPLVGIILMLFLFQYVMATYEIFFGAQNLRFEKLITIVFLVFVAAALGAGVFVVVITVRNIGIFFSARTAFSGTTKEIWCCVS